MKILFLTNSETSRPLVDWLAQREDVTVYTGKLDADKIRTFQAEFIVSYCYQYVLKRAVLDSIPGKCINLHISLLPYNRGTNPNAWSFLDDTPKGVTIHLIDEGIDTGPILLQKTVSFDETRETLSSSYHRLQEQIQTLFMENWADIRDGRIAPQPQHGAGTFHRSNELAELKQQLMDEQLLGKQGWDIEIALFRERYRQFTSSRQPD
jgi:methionyl-tRNA formyltransferase